MLAAKQPTITSATNITVNTLTATKLISNTLEVVGITDQITIKSNWNIFGNGLTHTIFISIVSELFSEPVFHEAIQVRNGIESGYYSASQPGNCMSTFTASQTGNA